MDTPSQITAHAVATVTFPVEASGYNRRDVDAFLAEASQVLAGYESRAADSLREEASTQYSHLLVKGVAAADELVAEARAEADAVREKAHQQAAEILGHAEKQAAELVAEAQAEADASRAAAVQAEADATRATTARGEALAAVAAAQAALGTVLAQFDGTAADVDPEPAVLAAPGVDADPDTGPAAVDNPFAASPFVAPQHNDENYGL